MEGLSVVTAAWSELTSFFAEDVGAAEDDVEADVDGAAEVVATPEVVGAVVVVLVVPKDDKLVTVLSDWKIQH